jgi:hypothetical protein
MANFKNIQIAASLELYDRFMQTFQESGFSTKSEFFRALLDSFQNVPPAAKEPATKPMVNTKSEIDTAKLKAVEMEYQALKIDYEQLRQQNEVLRNADPEKDSLLIDKDKAVRKLQKQLDLYNSKLQPLVDKLKGRNLYVGKRVLNITTTYEMFNLMIQTFKLQ